MRRLALLLFFPLFLAGCDDITGPGRRDLDGQWVAWVAGEEIWISLRDDRGRVDGSGEWGFDDVYVTGDRRGEEVYLTFDFAGYNPVDFEGEIRGRRLEGWLYGSGYDGEYVEFRRD